MTEPQPVPARCAATPARSTLRRFRFDAEGATSIEYALLGGGIAVAIVAAVGLVAPRLNAIFAAVTAGI